MNYRVIHDYGDKKVQTYSTEVPTEEALLAFTLLEKWGPVCAVEDGEDGAARAKFRSLTPVETVNRAFDIAQHAFLAARECGWMLTIPDLNELNKEAKDKVEVEV